MSMKNPLVVLKEFCFFAANLVAYGKGAIPPTMQSKAYPTLNIWLSNTKEPVMIPYEEEDERDKEFEIIHTLAMFIAEHG